MTGEDACRDIARVCTSAVRKKSRLNVLATSLADAIAGTESQPPPALSDRRQSTKATWAGRKSVTAILGDGVSVDHQAAYQVVIQGFTDEGAERGRDSRVNTGLWGERGLEHILEGVLQNPNEFTSCHPTAIGLQKLYGRRPTQLVAGGAGGPLRQAAVTLAKRCLNSADRLYIIQVKCTATNDGHSFSLLMNHDGTVSILEAWAMKPTRPKANLGAVWERRKTTSNDNHITQRDACDALDNLLNDNIRIRDRGYGVLSRAYGGRNAQHAHHYEELNRTTHDRRENHSIAVTVRELRPRQKVIARLQARLNKLKEIRVGAGHGRLEPLPA